MKIREIKKLDVDSILRIGNSAKEFKVSSEVVNFWPREILMKVVDDEKDFIVVAEEDKDIVGFLIVNLNLNFSKAIIENVFVKEKFRGGKVGKLLLDYALKKLQKEKCSYVCALVNSGSKNSIAWYIKQDFNKGIDCIWLDKVLLKTFKN